MNNNPHNPQESEENTKAVVQKTGTQLVVQKLGELTKPDAPWLKNTLTQIDRTTMLLLDRPSEGESDAIEFARKPLVWGVRIVVALFLIIVIWGFLAPIDSAAVARGTVVVAGSKKIIQHLEGGVITEILVKDGDEVKEGQMLMRLNPTAADASKEIMMNALLVARASEARLLAERDGAKEITFPESLMSNIESPEIANAVDAQKRLFASNRDAYYAKIGIFEQRVNQAHEQIKGLQAQVNSATQQVGFIEEEIRTVKQLLEKGSATRPRLLALERTKADLLGQKGQYLGEIARIRQATSETEIQVVNLKNEYLSQVSKELRDIQTLIKDTEEKLRASEDILSRTVILAPQAGIIQGLKFHTVGGVVTPGTGIMELIPQDEELVIEAMISPLDIDVVHPNLEARVRLTAFKSRSVPLLKGTVISVSPDLIIDPVNPQISYYKARIEIDSETVRKELLQDDVNRNIRADLYPGMPAEVLIRTGTRSFMRYLFSPILDMMNRSFREE